VGCTQKTPGDDEGETNVCAQPTNASDILHPWVVRKRSGAEIAQCLDERGGDHKDDPI